MLYLEITYLCSSRELESISHILLQCEFYNQIRNLFISSEERLVSYLLVDQCAHITLSVGRFFPIAMKIRGYKIKVMERCLTSDCALHITFT